MKVRSVGNAYSLFFGDRNHEDLAEQINGLIDAELYEILPAVPYTAADIAYYTDCRADREQSDVSARPDISGSVTDMSSQ